MPRFNTYSRFTFMFAAIFLLIGLLHVFLYGVFLTDNIAQLFCGAVVVLWALSVQRRITDARLRRMLLWTVAFMLLHNILQLMRYSFSGDDPIFRRYLWYAYYIPMIATPLLCFFTAISVYRSPEAPMPRSCALLIVFAVLMAFGFLTNDLHFFAFRFPTGVLEDNGDERRNLLYFLYCAWFGLNMLLALIITAHKSRKSVGLPLQLMTTAPVMSTVLLLILGIFGIRPHLNGIDLWKDGQIFIFGVLGFLESCIQLGLIPANRDYAALFALADLPAVILDEQERLVYRTANATHPFSESPDMKMSSHSIRGGSVRWLTDIGGLRTLNENLAETIRQIESRNAYLSEENRIRQERAELDTRNRLYDSISCIVGPQLEGIEARIQNAEKAEDFAAQLPRIAVLCAYVKRRSNMELLAADGLPLEELATAIAESLENIRLCGAATALQVVGNAQYPSKMLTAAYEQFEALMEACMDTLADLLVVLRAEEDCLTVRMLLQADAIEYRAQPQTDGAPFARQITVSTDMRDTIVTLTLRKGGVNT